ncbi:hypothetical protein C1646_771538 [Rhizophagus diaphanus]|nr:hypothetical protein C1646_771538 [Rhizophagus diaphanus] [Rhizophagus sp. MUCL 43196]
MIDWDSENQNWKRERSTYDCGIEKSNDSKNIEQEAMDEMGDLYGITWDRKTKTYLMIMSEICKKCFCNVSSNEYVKNALEWIPYKNFNDIKYIAKEGLAIRNKNWRRKVQNMAVALKSLNNSKNVTLEYMNESESLRHYLNISYNELNWELNTKNDIIHGVLPYIAPEILRAKVITKMQIFIVLMLKCKFFKSVEIKDGLWEFKLGYSTELQKQIEEINDNTFINIF